MFAWKTFVYALFSFGWTKKHFSDYGSFVNFSKSCVSICPKNERSVNSHKSKNWKRSLLWNCRYASHFHSEICKRSLLLLKFLFFKKFFYFLFFFYENTLPYFCSYYAPSRCYCWNFRHNFLIVRIFGSLLFFLRRLICWMYARSV